MKLGGTYWDETGCSVDAWNLFQTRVKPILVCSVASLKIYSYHDMEKLLNKGDC